MAVASLAVVVTVVDCEAVASSLTVTVAVDVRWFVWDAVAVRRRPRLILRVRVFVAVEVATPERVPEAVNVPVSVNVRVLVAVALSRFACTPLTTTAAITMRMTRDTRIAKKRED